MRVAEDETIDLSGVWNDTDSRLVAEEMIADVVSRPWISDFQSGTQVSGLWSLLAAYGISVTKHVNVNTFVADMERETD